MLVLPQNFGLTEQNNTVILSAAKNPYTPDSISTAERHSHRALSTSVPVVWPMQALLWLE